MIFYIDRLHSQEISYTRLIEDLRSAKFFNNCSLKTNYYDLFFTIILSLILDEEIILLDDDLTHEETLRLVDEMDNCRSLTSDELFLLSKIDNIDQLESLIYQLKKNWRITLFTSGTTGVPKKIAHTFETITRSVKKSEKHKSVVWGFAYNPTHMAGIQVFFQAFLNRNTIVRLFKLNRVSILEEIAIHNITHISATPTFYRLLLPVEETVCTSVRSLTSGGEKFDAKTFQSLCQLFPNAKITNVYASTEAGAVFASSGDSFLIKPEFLELVKIENDELFLHHTLVGQSDSLTISESGWYATGDIVEVLDQEPLRIRFLSRKNEMINVGGYKVNPGEVEEAIRLIDGIDDAIVYGKKNSLLGNIVCADVIRSNDGLTELEIRSHLQNRLQEFKVPRIVKFVSTFELTRTGKTKRK